MEQYSRLTTKQFKNDWRKTCIQKKWKKLRSLASSTFSVLEKSLFCEVLVKWTSLATDWLINNSWPLIGCLTLWSTFRSLGRTTTWSRLIGTSRISHSIVGYAVKSDSDGGWGVGVEGGGVGRSSRSKYNASLINYWFVSVIFCLFVSWFFPTLRPKSLLYTMPFI